MVSHNKKTFKKIHTIRKMVVDSWVEGVHVSSMVIEAIGAILSLLIFLSKVFRYIQSTKA